MSESVSTPRRLPCVGCGKLVEWAPFWIDEPTCVVCWDSVGNGARMAADLRHFHKMKELR